MEIVKADNKHSIRQGEMPLRFFVSQVERAFHTWNYSNPLLVCYDLVTTRKGVLFMSTVTIFSFLMILAYGAGVCFGYGITNIIDRDVRKDIK